MDDELKYEVRVANQYKVGKKIGAGSFGEIYLGLDIVTGKEVAVKFEPTNVRRPQVIEEARLLKEFKDQPGFPKFLWYGKEGDFHIMVFELLGPSLEDLFVYVGRKMSLKTVLLLADQLIVRIEAMHRKGYIHRDLKPENILMGLEQNASTLYLIDYGLAKKWKLSTGEHIPNREGKSLTGTARYASANTHLGYEQSRRDDLEGAAYVLLYLLKGELPWQGIRAKTKDEKYAKIKEAKVETPVEQMCEGYPQEIAEYLKYCRSLEFEEEPDYDKCRRIFKELYVKCCFENDFVYDWTVQRYRLDLDKFQAPQVAEEEEEGVKSTQPDSLKGNLDGQSQEKDENPILLSSQRDIEAKVAKVIEEQLATAPAIKMEDEAPTVKETPRTKAKKDKDKCLVF